MKELTKIQQRAFDFVKDHLQQKGYPPTIKELQDHMGYSAIGSAQCMVAVLRKKGFLVVPDRRIARSLVPADFSSVQYSGSKNDSLQGG